MYYFPADFQDLADLYVFDPATLKWTDLTGSMRGALPPPRQAAGALVSAQGVLYLLGGCQALTTGAPARRGAHSPATSAERWVHRAIRWPAQRNRSP